MTRHRERHHVSYVKNLNSARENMELRERTAIWLLRNPGNTPDKARTAVRKNARRHENHSMSWRAMSARGGCEPTGALDDAINRDFGSFERLKARFAEAGARSSLADGSG
jgi:Fe-Mn family superoxide dismutase